ncbi:MAG: TonB-dependent receptor [Steroidobacteraceae bacterium]
MRHLLQVSTILVAATATTYVQAQAPGEAATLEEIIVTAQKRDESLQDVPIAMTVATQEQIVRDQIYTFTDLQRVTPALEVSQTFGGESTGGGRIRGVGTNVFNPTATGSVAIVVDQLPQGNVSFPQVFDLAQVEVLRGPQGTLFGQTASAGVINITTAAPDPSAFAAKFGVAYSDKGTLGSEFGQAVVQGAVNLPVTDGSAFRLATFFKQEEGLQRNMYLQRDNKIKDWSFRARYLLKPTDSVSINLIGDYNKDDKDGTDFFALAKAPTNPASAAVQSACGVTILESAQQYCAARMPEESIKNFGVSAIVDWKQDGFSLTSLTGYRDRKRDQPYLDYTRAVGVPSAVDQQMRDVSDQITQELRISSNGDTSLDYVAGVFFSRYHYETEPMSYPLGVNTAPVGFSVCNFTGTVCPVPPAFAWQDSKVSSQAVFADLTYKLDEMWTVFSGLRYTKQKSDYSVGRNSPPTNSDSARDSKVSGRLGARWRPSEQTMIYSSVSLGFKGSLIEVNANPSVATVKLKPEEPLSFEVGAKFSLLDNRLAVDTNVFHTTVKNFHGQESYFVGTQLVSVSKNIDKIKSQGFEIDVLGSLTESLSLNSGYIYNDIKYPSGYIGDDGVNLGGLQFLSSPKHKFTLSGEYAMGIASSAEMFITLNGVYKSDLRLAARSGDAYVYPSHITIGGSVGIRSKDRKRSLSLFGRNLTNENEPIAYLANTFAGAADGGVRAWPAGGVTVREVGVALDLSF